MASERRKRSSTRSSSCPRATSSPGKRPLRRSTRSLGDSSHLEPCSLEPPSSKPLSPVEPWKDAIADVYREHQPDRIDRIDDLLKTYKGEERALYLRLCERYGVEPREIHARDVVGSGMSQTSEHAHAEWCERNGVAPALSGRRSSHRAASRPGSGTSERMQSIGSAVLRNSSRPSNMSANNWILQGGLREVSSALPAPKQDEACACDAPAEPKQQLTKMRKTRASSDWFTELFGFTESVYNDTQRKLKLSRDVGKRLSLEGPNGKRYKVGCFSTPTLAELENLATRKGGMSALPGKLRVINITGDVAALHSEPLNRHATFQVASQFNCLEFVNEDVTPERGVTGYVHDHTQGPACSIACGPATCFRNYFADVGGREGQRRDHQINNLADINYQLGNGDARYFKVANGYTTAKDEGLKELNASLEGMSSGRKQFLRGLLRVGVHEDVQVTSSDWGSWTLHDEVQTVTQVFGSACSVSYSGNGQKLWAPFASLVLSASYEATLYAALLTAIRHQGKHGSNRVFLTSLGGGVFGNAKEWILAAMDEAFRKFADVGLEVYIVSLKYVPDEYEVFAEEYAAK